MDKIEISKYNEVGLLLQDSIEVSHCNRCPFKELCESEIGDILDDCYAVRVYAIEKLLEKK